MNEIFVSVIIPLYNKERHIRKALQSVIDQTYLHRELIVVNDGSTDKSLEIVEQINRANYQQIRIIDQANQGVSITRNNGVIASVYPYIAFLDADDWWDSDYLQQMVDLIRCFPNAGIYGCRYWYVKNKQKRLTNIGLQNGFDSGYINYIRTYASTFFVPFNCSFVVVKKNVFKEFKGFHPKLKFGEDFHLWIRIALKYKVAYLNKPLAYSNQDVNKKIRALGEKIWNPVNHFIFNLSFLEKDENHNQELKKLLDGLRVRALLKYHLSLKYQKETKRELQKVDFSKQNSYYRYVYHSPRIFIKSYLALKKNGSAIKQNLIRLKS